MLRGSILIESGWVGFGVTKRALKLGILQIGWASGSIIGRLSVYEKALEAKLAGVWGWKQTAVTEKSCSDWDDEATRNLK